MAVAQGVSAVSLSAPTRLVGRGLRELRFAERYRVECLGLVRAGALHRLGEDPVIEEGDAILLLGKRADLQHFGEATCA